MDEGIFSPRSDWESLIKENSRTLHIAPEVYLKILSSSINQGEKDIKELESAIGSENFSLIQPLAHRLKGVYGNLRLEALYKTAEAIDSFAKEHRDIERIREQFVLFKKAFEELRMNVVA